MAPGKRLLFLPINFQRYVREFGFICVMLTKGNFTSGVMAGASFAPFSPIAVTEYNILKDDMDYSSYDCDIENCRERILIQTPFPADSPINSLGYSDSLIKLTTFDEDGNEGTALASISVSLNETRHPNQFTRTVLTWNCSLNEDGLCSGSATFQVPIIFSFLTLVFAFLGHCF
jgi:hypothetical protein